MEFVAGMVSWIWTKDQNEVNFEAEETLMNASVERDEEDELEAQEISEEDAYHVLGKLLEDLSEDPYKGNSEDIV